MCRRVGVLVQLERYLIFKQERIFQPMTYMSFLENFLMLVMAEMELEDMSVTTIKKVDFLLSEDRERYVVT